MTSLACASIAVAAIVAAAFTGKDRYFVLALLALVGAATNG